jgi:Nickel responsive protein SCO4226-like
MHGLGHPKVSESEEYNMPKFVIERELVGAGKLPKQELQAISQKSCSVLQSMGPQIQWVQSFVTDDKIYCVYIAPDEATVKAHAQKGGFPANVVARVRSVIDPTTAEAA